MIKNFSVLDDSQIQEYLNNKSLKIGIVGIGRIGLPTALSFANSGFNTVGIDINKKLVDMVNSGNYPLKDEPEFDKIFESVYNNKKITAITDISEVIPDCDVIILSLPTPMDDQNIPDYSALLTVGKNLNQLLSNGQIVIVESTVEPGFIENELLQSIEGHDRTIKSGIDFHLAVCPETANPGEIMNDFKKLPRLVGAIDEKISSIVSQIYKHVFGVELIQLPNCKTANAVKLTTNVFRDVNIAFVNELAILFDKLGIDTYTVINAAKHKYNFQAHFPGPGVGGPCLPVNSYQYLNSSKKIDPDLLKIIQHARKINEKMPDHVIELTSDAFKESNKSIQNSNILILGVSYKPNIKDIQLSPAEHIIRKFQNLGVNIHIYDPYFFSSEVFGIKVEENLDDILPKMDAVIIVTDHHQFKNIEISSFKKMKNPILIDTRGIFDPISVKHNNIIFRGLGRGNF
jgi:nucleotide sugar dehydrogenase